MSEDRREPVSDAQIDAAAEAWARAEEDDLALAWGQGILDATAGHAKGRADEDRALLDAIGRATKAKGQE
jgi:hypothetical protein